MKHLFCIHNKLLDRGRRRRCYIELAPHYATKNHRIERGMCYCVAGVERPTANGRGADRVAFEFVIIGRAHIILLKFHITIIQRTNK